MSQPEPLLHPLAEAQLWQAWAESRDDDAAAELWRRSQRVALAVARRCLGQTSDPAQEAPGIVDEAFVRALRTFAPERATTRTEKPFRAWFLRLVRSAAIDRRRKLAREVSATEELDGCAASDAHLDDYVDARRLVARLREWNDTEGLEEDWPVLVAWLQCRHDGVRVPWKQLAEAHPVTAPPDVRFALGQAHVSASDIAMGVASRKLSLCPRLQLSVAGGHERPELAVVSAARRDNVMHGLRERLPARRVPGQAAPAQRVLPLPESVDGPRATFGVLSGGLRTCDALRMRVEKVILGRLLAVLQSGARA